MSQGDMEVIDRSTLERWATCPRSAWLHSQGLARSVGRPAHVGEESHKALGTTIHSWVMSGGTGGASFLRNEATDWLRQSRPDVQPAVLSGMMPSLSAWCDMIARIHPDNILAFDGGEEAGRGGMLAIDFPDLGIKLASELDLLYSGPAPTVLHEVDYKTGWRDWTINDVFESFQFQVHALLVFTAWPDVKTLEVSVWSTRHGRALAPVQFHQRRLEDYRTRVRMAIHKKRLNERLEDAAEAWPTPTACGQCDAIAHCRDADLDAKAVAEDPAAAVIELDRLERKAAAMRSTLTSHVRSIGRDITATNGVCFGTCKPKAIRTPTCDLYTIDG